jgi:hypothetical protein
MLWPFRSLLRADKKKTQPLRKKYPLAVEALENREVLSGLGNVTYHGGPLLQHVQIESVFYGQPWVSTSGLQQLTSQVDGFLSYFVTSPYVNVLQQYTVGTGAFENDVVLNQNPTGQMIDDSQIRQILDAGVASGQLAADSANQLYVFFTAPGVEVTANGQNSISGFAGYHDTFTDSAGAPVYYAVVPYPNGGVSNVQLSDLQQMTVILSHEVSEAMTDPDTQSGWFDPRQGEIGDLAEGTLGTLNGYTVQGVWSQDQGRVVVPSAATSSTGLQITGDQVLATAGQEFSGLVATLTGTPFGAAGSSFTATIDWGDGVTSNGTLVTDPNGGFDITGSHTFGNAGSYPVTVTVSQNGTQVGSALTSASVATATTPASQTLTAQGLVFTASAGQAFTGTVATFTDSNPNASTSGVTATIDWGDGTTSTGPITAGSTGVYSVTGTHTYASAMSFGFATGGWGVFDPLQDFFGNQLFVVKVTIDDTSMKALATTYSLATVAPRPPEFVATSQNIETTSGQSFTGVVATITSTVTGATTSDFTATIHWGDGTTSTGSITADPRGTGFDVTGTHTYTNANDWFGFGHHQGGTQNYQVSVTITDTTTQQQTVTEGVASVTSATPNLVVTAENIQPTSSELFSGTVAKFTDTNSAVSSAGFMATIYWGDGTYSTGTVVADPNGGFDVTGTHTYTLNSDQPVGWGGWDSLGESSGATLLLRVVIQGSTMADSGSALGFANVAPAPADVQGAGTAITAVYNQSFTGAVAAFTPQSSTATASDFTATINWGDGTTSTGTIVAGPNGTFQVTGTHTYATLSGGEGGGGWFGGWGGDALHGRGVGSGEKLFLITVAIQDTTNNDVTNVAGLANVSPAPSNLVATGQTLKATAGTAFSATVTTFTDSTVSGTSGISALIGWGDGTISRGTVAAGSNGTFTVNGNHTYAVGGTYNIVVRLADAAGNFAVALGSAVVADNVSGTALATVAANLVTSSEYFSDLTIQYYQQLLSRIPGSLEVAGWVNAMQHGASDAQVMAGFLASGEYYQRVGNTNTAWVDALYQTVLQRAPDDMGQASWLQALQAGTPRSAVALGFADSSERAALLVQNDYQKLLGRTASAAEVAGWVSAFEAGATNEQVLTGFLSSGEFFQRNNANAHDWLFAAYETVLSRQPDQYGLSTWMNVLA